MIGIRSILTVFVLLALVAFTAGAEDTKEAAKAEAPAKLKNQTHCPVMGGAIDSTAYTDIQGQRVYHCCPGCSEALKADPDKYFKKAAAEGVLFENIQTTCPVGGEELKSKTVHADYEGRRLLFCEVECSDAFHKDPEKYLKGMDGKPRVIENKETEKHQEHGHSCKGHS
jgi:YHS domain-containing protein